jgi:hypothetical protein
MMLYYFVEFAGSFANIALLLLFIGRLFPKKEPVSRWFYAYVALLIAGQCALSLFPDWVTQPTDKKQQQGNVGKAHCKLNEIIKHHLPK